MAESFFSNYYQQQFGKNTEKIMKMRQLLQRWQALAGESEATVNVNMALPLRDMARVLALADLYPALKLEELLAELLHVALDDVQEAFPYVNGNKIVGEDEEGNPMYEDIGQTPRFLQLTQQHLAKLKN